MAPVAPAGPAHPPDLPGRRTCRPPARCAVGAVRPVGARRAASSRRTGCTRRARSTLRHRSHREGRSHRSHRWRRSWSTSASESRSRYTPTGAPPLQLKLGVVETIRMSPLPEPLISTQALMVVAVMAKRHPQRPESDHEGRETCQENRRLVNHDLPPFDWDLRDRAVGRKVREREGSEPERRTTQKGRQRPEGRTKPW